MSRGFIYTVVVLTIFLLIVYIVSVQERLLITKNTNNQNRVFKYIYYYVESNCGVIDDYQITDNVNNYISYLGLSGGLNITDCNGELRLGDKKYPIII